MRCRYTLTMNNLVISPTASISVHIEKVGDIELCSLSDQSGIDELVLEWEEETSPDKIMIQSQRWVTCRLPDIITGIQSIGESSLTIKPVGEKEF